MGPFSTDEIRRLVGDPQLVADRLARFRETTELLSSDKPRMIDQYAKLWVALFDKKVQASAGTLGDLMQQIESAGLPRENVVVRFIDNEPRTLIL